MESGRGGWFIFRAKGHRNVRATHRSTLEITREDYLTPRGDCIIGVSAEAGLADLPEWLREGIRRGWTVVMVLCAEGICDSVIGRGDPRLTLEDPTRMIVRKSTHIDGRTLMICANKSARDLDRGLVQKLAGGAPLTVAVSVIPAPLKGCPQRR